MFYAPWCHHCKRLEPEYAKAAAEVKGALEGRALAVAFARVDATEEAALADAHGVDGYPDIQLFRHGVASGMYRGPHEASAVAEWAAHKADPKISVLDDWSDVRAFVAADADVFVVAKVHRDAAVASVRRAAADLGDGEARQAIAVTSHRELAAAKTAASEYVVVTTTLNEDEPSSVLELTAATTAADIVRFVEARSAPLVTMFESSQETAFFARDVGPAVHILLLLDLTLPSAERLLDDFSAVASALREEARHVYVPASEARVLEHFGLDKADLPRLVVTDLRATRPDESKGAPRGRNSCPLPPLGETRTYRAWPSAAESRASMTAFLEAYLEGRVEPWLRSEAVTYDDPITGVVRLTGTSFGDTVLRARADPKDATDWFVMFHAPWCGHCAALMFFSQRTFEAPTWTSAAERFAAVDSVVLAKMDATANEVAVEGVAVKGFPTIYWFPSDGAKPPLLYDEPRDLDSIVRFVHDHATAAFDLHDDGADL